MNHLKLVFEDGNEFNMQDKEIFIGREPTNHLTIPDPHLSRHHARLALVDGQWTIDDIGSTLGTTLNGDPVRQPMVIKAGDVIKFGRTIEARVEALVFDNSSEVG